MANIDTTAIHILQLVFDITKKYMYTNADNNKILSCVTVQAVEVEVEVEVEVHRSSSLFIV